MSNVGEERSRHVLFLLQARQTLGVLAFGIVGTIPIFLPSSLENSLVFWGGILLLILGLIGCFSPMAAAENNIDFDTQKLKNIDEQRMQVKTSYVRLVENQSDDNERSLIDTVGNAIRDDLQRSSLSFVPIPIISKLSKTKVYLPFFGLSIFLIVWGIISELQETQHECDIVRVVQRRCERNDLP